MRDARDVDIDAMLREIADHRSKDALAQLYRATASSVYAYALSILRSPQDAEDALHDCFVRIFDCAPGYVSQGKPMAWIMTIARNLSFQRLRKRKMEADIAQENWEKRSWDEQNLPTEDRLVVWAYMSALSKEEQQIVVLHAVAGLRHREIAKLTEMPLSTVLSKYARAMHKLRKQIESEEESNA